MKKVISVVFVWAVLAMPCAVFAQQQVTVNTQTTETAGTISEVSPDGIVIRSGTNPSPINYTYTKSTTYVDETGAPVALETVKSGQPVTVHYVTEGGRTTATRVIVRKITTTTDGPSIEKKTTTTTTTENK